MPKMFRSLMVATALIAGPASSQDVVKLDSLTFMIEAPKRIGQRVRIRGDIIYVSFDFTTLAVPGGVVTLRPPWIDREDFRKLIPACEISLGGNPACTMNVEGTIETIGAFESPTLIDVDFDVPD